MSFLGSGGGITLYPDRTEHSSLKNYDVYLELM